MGNLAELRCAATIANLEGSHFIDLPSDGLEIVTLSALDRRVRRLEDSMKITSPPPVMDLSWDGLVWRLWRLRVRSHPTMTCIPGSFSGSNLRIEHTMLPNADAITVDSLRHAVESINSADLRCELRDWPKCASDDEMMTIALQTLCYVAGKRRTYFDVIPTTLVDAYVCAVHLSLSIEARASAPVPIPVPAGRPAPPLMTFPHFPAPPNPGQLKVRKSCCDCCACFCHTPRAPIQVPRRRRLRSVSTSSTDSYVGRKKPRFAWLSKLLFWRKASPDRRGRSPSTSSGTTIYD